MSRDDDSIGRKIKTLVAFVIGRITKKNTQDRPRCKFVGRGSGNVGITTTPKNPKMVIGGRMTKEGLIWCRKLKSGCGVTIEEISGGVEGLNPIGRRKMGLKKK